MDSRRSSLPPAKEAEIETFLADFRGKHQGAEVATYITSLERELVERLRVNVGLLMENTELKAAART
jgi:hypothetical protein